jgi:hypothetical protein
MSKIVERASAYSRPFPGEFDRLGFAANTKRDRPVVRIINDGSTWPRDEAHHGQKLTPMAAVTTRK